MDGGGRGADDAPSSRHKGGKRKRGTQHKRREKSKANDGDATACKPIDRYPAVEERREDTTAELVVSQEACPPQPQLMPAEKGGREEDIAHAGNSEATEQQLPTKEQVRNPEAGVVLRCPPHPLSEILTALKTSASRQDAATREPVDEQRALKYCVVVSVFALVCLYYAGFLAAYLLLSPQREHRPSAATRDLPRTPWEFRPSTTSRQETSTPMAPP